MVFLVGGANSATGYEIENSLRSNGTDSYLNFTLGTPTSQRIATFSAWGKFNGQRSGSNDNSFWSMGDDAGQAMNVVRTAGTPQIYLDDSDGKNISFNNGPYLRDSAAWYHFVVQIDTTQSTATNRMKWFINGTQLDNTTASHEVSPDQNYDIPGLASGQTMSISKRASSSSHYIDGYIAEMIYLDGSIAAPTAFGKVNDNGVWIPKKPAGLTFGNNGAWLEFKQTGTSANASGIGADTSGNGNHYTVNNLAAIDVTTDTPTNNFATMNPLDNFHSGFTFSEGNCKFVTAGSSNAYNTATIGDLKQGKWYLEVKYTDPSSTGSGGSLQYYGAISAIGHKLSDGVSDTDTSTDLYATSYLHNFGYDINNGRIKNNNQAGTVHGAAGVEGNIIGFLLDLDNNRVTTHLNGQYADGSGNHDESSPTAYVSITAPASTPLGGYMIGFDETVGSSESGNQNTGTYEINFGNPTFSISSGNADANGYGNFEYAVPSGYYALCTKNLAEYG